MVASGCDVVSYRPCQRLSLGFRRGKLTNTASAAGFHSKWVTAWSHLSSYDAGGCRDCRLALRGSAPSSASSSPDTARFSLKVACARAVRAYGVRKDENHQNLAVIVRCRIYTRLFSAERHQKRNGLSLLFSYTAPSRPSRGANCLTISRATSALK